VSGALEPTWEKHGKAQFPSNGTRPNTTLKGACCVSSHNPKAGESENGAFVATNKGLFKREIPMKQWIIIVSMAKFQVKSSLFIFQSWGVLKTHPFTGCIFTIFTTHGNDYFSGAQFTIFVRKPTKHDDNLGRMLTLRIKQKSLLLAVHD